MMFKPMGNAAECDESAIKRRGVTSQHHIFVLYFMLTLCILTITACLTLICGVRQRQSLVEQKLGFSEEEGCCKCCQRFETHQKQTNLGHESRRGKVYDLLLQNNPKDLGSNAATTSSNHNMSLRLNEVPQHIARARRHLDDSRTQSSVINSTSTAMTTSTEVDDLDRSSSFDLTTITTQWDGSNAEKTVPHEADISLGGKSNSNDKILSRSPRETTEESNNDGRKKTNKKTQSKNKSSKSGTAKTKKNDRHGQHHLAAIHMQAPEHFERRYESGPVISFNTSNKKVDTVYRFWQKASWVDSSVSEVFHLDEVTGHVTVEIEGIYLIYAQVVYHDLSGRWSFGVYVGDQERVKCLATEQLKDLHNYHQTSHGVYHSCYTAIVLHIRRNQSVSIRCLYGSRTILTRPEFTFWGLVRLS